MVIEIKYDNVIIVHITAFDCNINFNLSKFVLSIYQYRWLQYKLFTRKRTFVKSKNKLGFTI